MSKWIELSFIEDVKALSKYGLKEYYNKANKGLYEFLNPDLAYPYQIHNAGQGQKMWVIDKQKKDPILVVTLKNSNQNYWVLDFYFPENEQGFSKNQKMLEGKYYLDTISKIVRDEVIPYFIQSNINTLVFEAYTEDGGGKMRKNLFQRMIGKFALDNNFDIQIEDNTFIIKK
jgi:hypothetical protein